jgi:Fe-S cluster biosynthesis and repair protein YggX
MQINSARTPGKRSWHSDQETGWTAWSRCNITSINYTMLNANTGERKKKLKQNNLCFMIKVIPDQNGEELNVCR